MKLLGVIGTVAWRQRAFLITLASLARQTQKPDQLAVLYDGFDMRPHTEPATQELRRSAANVIEVTRREASRGCVERLRVGMEVAAVRKMEADALVIVFDDDLVYPEAYVAYMVATQRRVGGVIALSGLTAKGQHPHYTEERAIDMPLSEPNVGVSVMPLHVLRGAFADPHAAEYLHTWTAEIFLGYYCWKHQIPITRPAGRLIVSYLPEAVDDRCVWHQHGREEQQAFRERFQILTGWNPRAAAPALVR